MIILENNLISIIIPIYNTEKYLNRCIETVVNQTYSNLEIILINDGSTDNSKEICEEWCKKDNRIIFINKDNTGVSDTRNKGLEIAKGEYISFIDSDDYIELNFYEKLLKCIMSEKTDIVMCGYNRIYENKIEKHLYSYPNKLDKYSFLMKPMIIEGFIWNKLFKKDIIANLRFYSDIAMTEDKLFLFEYLDKINNISILNEPLYNYNVYNYNSITHKKDPKCFINTIKSHHYINKILEKYDIQERYNFQANSVCNYVIYKKQLGKDFDYTEYEDIIKEYKDNKVLFKVRGIQNKIKVFLACYFDNVYIKLKNL